MVAPPPSGKVDDQLYKTTPMTASGTGGRLLLLQAADADADNHVVQFVSAAPVLHDGDMTSLCVCARARVRVCVRMCVSLWARRRGMMR